MEFTVNNIDELPQTAEAILKESGDFRLFGFYGEMGAGKTSLVVQMLKALGVRDAGSSPTFSIVNEYASKDGKPVYHFDFYRIEDVEEVYDIGYEDYFFSGSYCFMEWPERIDPLLPEDTVKIYFELEGETRKIKLDLPS